MTAMLVLGLAVLLVASLGSADPADPPGVSVHPPNDPVRNLAGAPGALIAHGLMTALGAAAWLVAAAVLSLGIGLARNRDRVPAWQWVCGWSLLLVSACAALHGVVPGLAGGLVVGSGGYVGAWSMIRWQSRDCCSAENRPTRGGCCGRSWHLRLGSDGC